MSHVPSSVPLISSDGRCDFVGGDHGDDNVNMAAGLANCMVGRAVFGWGTLTERRSPVKSPHFRGHSAVPERRLLRSLPAGPARAAGAGRPRVDPAGGRKCRTGRLGIDTGRRSTESSLAGGSGGTQPPGWGAVPAVLDGESTTGTPRPRKRSGGRVVLPLGIKVG